VFTSPIKILLICSVRMSPLDILISDPGFLFFAMKKYFLIQDFNKRDIAFLKCVILANVVLPRILRDYRVEVYFTYGQNNSTLDNFTAR
jgi:hypothetical protein